MPPFGGHVMAYIRMRILSTLKSWLFMECLEAKYTVMYAVLSRCRMSTFSSPMCKLSCFYCLYWARHSCDFIDEALSVFIVQALIKLRMGVHKYF